MRVPAGAAIGRHLLLQLLLAGWLLRLYSWLLLLLLLVVDLMLM
jgi:hypothetical protein